VLIGHGSGGKLTAELIRTVFVPAFGGRELAKLGDAAVVEMGALCVAFTTDSFVVDPPEFPGSDIGALAVNGTVNDLAMMGATPLYMATAFILEEGFPMDTLRRIVASMADAARTAGVELVTGDTKVVERGSGDGVFITTSGIGLVPPGVLIGPDRARPGDVVLVSGPIGSHGVAVMSRRAGIGFDADVASDTAPLTGLVQAMLAAGDVRCLRDATRGGVASVLNELAEASGVSITVRDEGPTRAGAGSRGVRDARPGPGLCCERRGLRCDRRARRCGVGLGCGPQRSCRRAGRDRGRGGSGSRAGSHGDGAGRDTLTDHAGRRAAPPHLLTRSDPPARSTRSRTSGEAREGMRPGLSRDRSSLRALLEERPAGPCGAGRS